MSEPWVLLRGWSRESAHWGAFPAHLRAALPDAAVVAVDLPGNGGFRHARSPLSIAGAVDHCRRVLQERGISGPLHLLGLSMGAMACIDWAGRFPGEVAGAVLVNTSARPFARLRHRLRPGSYARVARLALFERCASAREAGVLALTSTRGGDAALIAQWAAIARERPVSLRNVFRQLVAAARFSAPAQPPAVPILVLASEGDRLVDPEASRRLALAWNVPLGVHPCAGHDLTLDDGPWVAQQVRRWIRPS